MNGNSELISLIVNVAIVVILLVNVVRCYFKGFLLSLWECFGTLFALLVAWNFSSVLAEMFHVYPLSWTPMAETILGPLFNASLNRFAWVLILFVAIKLLLLLLKPVVKLVQSLPILKQINQLVGAVFGVVITWMWALLAVFILSVPVFEQGEAIMGTTLLGPVKTISVELLDSMGEVLLENETLSRLLAGEALTEKDKDILMGWLQEYHLDEESLAEYFK